MFSKKVYIAPLHEHTDPDRLVEPARNEGADCVYLLQDDSVTEEVVATVTEQLTDDGASVETVPCDVTDVYSIFGHVTTIADDHDDNVCVNVSTGTKRSAIGATLGCMDDETDATAYFVEDTEPAVRTQENRSVFERLPEYPIDSPTRSQVTALAIVAFYNTQAFTSKKRTIIEESLTLHASVEEPIDFGRTMMIKQTENNNSNSQTETNRRRDSVRREQEITQWSDLDSAVRKSSYRRFDKDVLGPIAERGYVEVHTEDYGRADGITLTDSGQNTLIAFRHKVTDVVDELKSRPRTTTPEWLSTAPN